MPITDIIYRGKKLNLYKKKIRLPNGYISAVELVEHPGAAVIVPFLSDGRLIILRQYRPVIGRYLYEFPAGTIDNGERPLNCAKREILEETGFSASRFAKIGVIYPVPGYSTEIITIYKACGLNRKERAPERDEVIKNIVVTKAELRGLFKKGSITDAKTICALALCGII